MAEAPRWRFMSGRKVAIEPEAGAAVIAALEERGHEITTESPESSFGFGGAQLVCVLGDGFIAGSDPRKDGQAVGF